MSTSSARCDSLTLRPDGRWRAAIVAAHALAGAGLLAGGVPLALAAPVGLALALSAALTWRRRAAPLVLRLQRHRPECSLRQRGTTTSARFARVLWRSPWVVGLELRVAGRRRRQRLWLAWPWMSRADLRRLRLWLLSLPGAPTV